VRQALAGLSMIKMPNAITSAVGFFILFSSGPSQEHPRQLKGGGHLLGETAEHFFSEGAVGRLLHACDAADWKTVKQLAKAVGPGSKPNAKDICDRAALIKQQATSGARQEFGDGDDNTVRTDTFTLDGGALVKINLVFSAPATDVEGYHPKHFGELFEGLREAYGEPSKRYTEPVFEPMAQNMMHTALNGWAHGPSSPLSNSPAETLEPK
jgi:hypothetical protein